MEYKKERIIENTCCSKPKTKKILSIKVTDEHVHDSKAKLELVENSVKSDNMMTTPTAIGKLFADGAYDGNDIFRYLGDKGIQPCIKVRKNSKVRLKTGYILRNLSVIYQKKDLQKWKDSVSYWTKMDCRNRVFLYKAKVWRIRLFC